MSFRCDICDTPQETGTKPIVIVAEDRVRHYENKYRRNHKTVTVKSKGWEIVKEKRVCADCNIAEAMPDENGGLDAFDDN